MDPAVRDLMATMDYGPAPESPDRARAWITGHGEGFDLFIGGTWTPPAEDARFDTLDPSSGQVLARVAQAGPEDVDRAVRAANEAYETWSKTSGAERARVLYALARQIQKHHRILAVLESLDNGKPIRETRDIDVPLVARHFLHHAGWAQIADSELPNIEPIGVVGQIIPWNFPLLMLAWKIAPALAMGNTVILKPAEFTPLTALYFAELCEAAGVPPGVINILTGDGRTGQAIVEHPGIKKIAFTGSTEVGRLIRSATAGTGKRLSLELGGKSPFIVFDDADQDSAIEGIVDAIWFNQGQVCCAGSRLLIQESIAEIFLAKLRRRMETLRIGHPLDKAIDIGAIIAPVQLERIEALVRQGLDEGAEMFQPKDACPREGWFYPPTLLSNVSPASTVAQIEIFGPVLVAMTFRTPAEAVALANNTVYGLAASVWSENVNLSLDIAHRVKAGTVWVNCTNQFDAASGFGGYRESGFGREGGREGLFEYGVYRQDSVRQPRPRGNVATEAGIDRTLKQFVGGAQVRPDSGNSVPVLSGDGRRLGEAPLGNRKDIRNAVEAALAAQPAWAGLTSANRAQILYFWAENLAARSETFEGMLVASGLEPASAHTEVRQTIDALFSAAAYADKFDGAVHDAPFRGVVYTQQEPLGVIGIALGSDYELLDFCRAVALAIAKGNAVVAAPSWAHPLPALEMAQILDVSDVPGGIVNIVSGRPEELVPVMAGHEAIDGLWVVGLPALAEIAERESTSNLKQTWVVDDLGALPDRDLLRRATQVKNIWVPVGE